ncbi:hypothetical protein THAOC_26668, partial [Thalassiosira oceanica]
MRAPALTPQPGEGPERQTSFDDRLIRLPAEVHPKLVERPRSRQNRRCGPAQLRFSRVDGRRLRRDGGCS